MKNFRKSTIALLLTLILAISSFAIIPVDAATLNTEESGASLNVESSKAVAYPSGTTICYALSDGKISTYTASGNYTGYIDGKNDQCKILSFSTTAGRIRVSYPTSKGTKTAYAPLGSFVYNTNFNRYKAKIGNNVKVFTKSNMSKQIGTAYKNDSVWVVSTIGNKAQIIYPISGGYKMGWIYTSAPTTTYYVTTTSGLYLRQSASTSSKALVKMTYSSALSVSSISNGWAKATYTANGKTYSGYCSSAYISKNKPAQYTYTPISLSINNQQYNYKQYDSRWKNTKIGTKTIGQIGCTLTCVSMVYSYQQRTNVYPNTMKSKLTFSNNDVNWSSVQSRIGYTTHAYNNCSISQSIMKTIYTQLKTGKPVIIGCKSKSSSGYHWVVITGYTTNSNTLSANCFTINDPNSASRLTLQQYLNYYPYVYKLVY